MHVSSIQISNIFRRTVCSLRGPLPVQGHQPAASISNSPQVATFVSQAKRRNASGSFRFSSSRKQLAAGRCVSCYQFDTWIGSKRNICLLNSKTQLGRLLKSVRPSVPRRHTLFESIQRRSEAYIICARNMGCPCPFRACLRQHNWHAHRCTCFIQRKEPLLTLKAEVSNLQNRITFTVYIAPRSWRWSGC